MVSKTIKTKKGKMKTGIRGGEGDGIEREISCNTDEDKKNGDDKGSGKRKPIRSKR